MSETNTESSGFFEGLLTIVGGISGAIFGYGVSEWVGLIIGAIVLGAIGKWVGAVADVLVKLAVLIGFILLNAAIRRFVFGMLSAAFE